MNRLDHRLLGGGWGAALGAGLHVTAGVPVGVAVGCGLIAAGTGGGPLSPDIDQLWRDRTEHRRVRVGWLVWDLGKRRRRAALWARAARSCWRGFAWCVTRLPWWRDHPRSDPAQHRGITHWWGAAALATVLLAALQTVGWAAGWDGPWWAAWAALVGWWSHLGGDLVHGRKVWGQDDAGIPLAPYWNHAGAGLKSDGWTAHVVAFLAAPAGMVLLIAVAGG